MFKATISPRKSEFVLKIDYSLYMTIDSAQLEHVGKVFEDKENAENHLVSCAISFVNVTFENFCNRLKAIAPYIFHSESRNIQWMENYWKALELRDVYFAPSKSPYYRSKILLEYTSILINAIPENTTKTEDFKEQLRDIIKVSMMLDRYISPIVEQQKKDWYAVEDKEVEDELKNVA